MKKYFEVAKLYLKVKLMWRADLLFGFISIVMKIIFASLLWGVIFMDKKTVAGFTQNSMMTYYLFSSLFTQIDISEKISGDITRGIRNGTFTKYMAMPMDPDKYFLAMEAGAILPHIVLDAAAVVLIGLGFGIKIRLTPDISGILYALLIAFLGLLFMAQLSYLLGIMTFRFEEISTFMMIKQNILALITGSIVPLALLPEILVKCMRVLPFYYTAYLPSMLLIGRNRDEAFVGVFIMLGWNLGIRFLTKSVYEDYRVKYDGAGI